MPTWNRLRIALVLLALPVRAADDVPAAGTPSPEALRDFAAYIRLAESRMDSVTRDPDGFLWADTTERRGRLRQAAVVCEPRNGRGAVKVRRGLVHNWVGAAFIPGSTVARVLALVQDYDHHGQTYRPDVISSRTLARDGNDFKVRLRVLQRKIVTVALDTDYDIHYRPLSGRDWESRSYSTRIIEIANPGTARERERGPRDDHGYLWRLNSYWLFRERDGGVYVECEVVSLSRAVPPALAWLIDPIVRGLPKDALDHALRTTRTLAMRPSGSLRPPSLRFPDVFMTFAAAARLESWTE
jgi:hypothetical protein